MNRRDVRRRFDAAAAGFDGADFVHRHAATGLFERLSPMVLDVERILDAGSATGAASRYLARSWRKSRVISLDLSFSMLDAARKNRSRFARISEVQADAQQLPIGDGCIDLVFANMLLPWSIDAAGFLAEVRRVLRKDGVFAFSTFGPDSLREVREAWAEADDDEHVNAFPDMHDIGDQAVRAGLRDPVLDVDYLTVTYRSSNALFRDLTAAGARNCLQRRRRTLTGKQRFARMCEALDRNFRDGALPLRLELVFGHAFGSGPVPAAGAGYEYRLDVRDIGRRRR
ncbi:MAG TPA: methyltransferase domain-containing protein [Woeseiaceae bacterium]|nr:methyltransferase domain-containing protein [Woeseiaceae bacterium]